MNDQEVLRRVYLSLRNRRIESTLDDGAIYITDPRMTRGLADVVTLKVVRRNNKIYLAFNDVIRIVFDPLMTDLLDNTPPQSDDETNH